MATQQNQLVARKEQMWIHIVHVMRLPPRRMMRTDSPAIRAEEFRVPNQRRKEPRFPDGTEENPQEHFHKRRTLMSLQEFKIYWCTPMNSR